jgi:hypothetical protein
MTEPEPFMVPADLTRPLSDILHAYLDDTWDPQLLTLMRRLSLFAAEHEAGAPFQVGPVQQMLIAVGEAVVGIALSEPDPQEALGRVASLWSNLSRDIRQGRASRHGPRLLQPVPALQLDGHNRQNPTQP